MILKAFIFAGNVRQYEDFIRENRLNRKEYPYLNEVNWRGIRNADLIRIGTYYENKKMMDLVPYIDHQLKEK